MQVGSKHQIIVEMTEAEAHEICAELNKSVFLCDATIALCNQLNKALNMDTPAPLAKTAAEPKASRKNKPLTLNEKNTNTSCKICGREFAKARGLSRHMTTHRDDGDRASRNLDADDAE